MALPVKSGLYSPSSDGRVGQYGRRHRQAYWHRICNIKGFPMKVKMYLEREMTKKEILISRLERARQQIKEGKCVTFSSIPKFGKYVKKISIKKLLLIDDKTPYTS